MANIDDCMHLMKLHSYTMDYWHQCLESIISISCISYVEYDQMIAYEYTADLRHAKLSCWSAILEKDVCQWIYLHLKPSTISLVDAATCSCGPSTTLSFVATTGIIS